MDGSQVEDGIFHYHPVQKRYPTVQSLSLDRQKRILVTGGCGFVGSHLVDRLMKMGHLVTVLDNMFTGRRRNVEHWIGHPHFELVRHDIVDPFMIEVDEIYHLACAASPVHYQTNPVKTIKTNVMGTLNMLGLAKRTKAKFLLASTSEVYGDPLIHPQPETYFGNVNPTGPRACYDEGKRVAETLTLAYHNQDHVDTRIVRIFNTFGPRMNPFDGRVVSNFIYRALKKESLCIYGDGSFTRSFQFVHDLIDALILAMQSDHHLPVNIGNPQELTMLELAKLIEAKIGYPLNIEFKAATEDDPKRRKPDISKAKLLYGWEPKCTIEQGLDETIAYFKLL
jgi:UDP-glucuronate decarboxylase